MTSPTSRNERPSTARPGDEIGPSRYRKKPVEIEAIRWSGTNLKEVIDFTGLHPSAEKWTWEEYVEVVRMEGLKIFTLEGAMMAAKGDFIIKGVKGEFYPCKPDIFVATYQRSDFARSENAATHRAQPITGTPAAGVAAGGEAAASFDKVDSFLQHAEALGLMSDQDLADEVKRGALPVVEEYAAGLKWSDAATEHEKALVVGNLRSFWMWLHVNSRGRIMADLAPSAGLPCPRCGVGTTSKDHQCYALPSATGWIPVTERVPDRSLADETWCVDGIAIELAEPTFDQGPNIRQATYDCAVGAFICSATARAIPCDQVVHWSIPPSATADSRTTSTKEKS